MAVLQLCDALTWEHFRCFLTRNSFSLQRFLIYMGYSTETHLFSGAAISLLTGNRLCASSVGFEYLAESVS